MSLYLQTLKALVHWRRAIPIFVVVAAILGAQHYYSHGRWQADVLAVVMCAAFFFFSPFAWRTLFPPDKDLNFRLFRFIAFGCTGVVPLFIAVEGPRLFYIGPTFLTSSPDLAVVIALYLVGGWGLGRDIELELGWEKERLLAEQLRNEAERAQLMALRAHLDPHFLFNTLNAIAEWCREDAETAEQALLRLSGLLREILDGAREWWWPLSRELNLINNLWQLHQTRDPGRFSIKWDASEIDPELVVPPLILLPLAENAVKHGPLKGNAGILHLKVSLGDDRLKITIINPGPFEGPRDGGEGLTTVEKRLKLAYDSQGAFYIAGGKNTTAVLDLPAITMEQLPNDAKSLNRR
ncbi:MAG: histidine kinase [Proteobacteria bacterium]|nr:histidine kinase [Pseudomonadota bacterium]